RPEFALGQDLSQKLLKKVLPKHDKEKVNELSRFYQENLVYQLYDDTKEIINLPYQKAILSNSQQFAHRKFLIVLNSCGPRQNRTAISTMRM
ncbi:unnamed protein product, partial [marine sediment metagenome]